MAKPEMVLLVEDDPAVTRAIGRLVLAEGYELTNVATAEKAIDYLNTNAPPCLVVLNLSLPGMSGVELVRWMGRQERFRGVRVAVVSASAHLFAQLQPFREHMVVRVLEKPFEIAHLTEVLHHHCGGAV